MQKSLRKKHFAYTSQSYWTIWAIWSLQRNFLVRD